MGPQLRHLFIVILIHCSPVDPHHLWEATRDSLCDDPHHWLIHTYHIPAPTQDQVYDYGLYLIAQDLRRHGKYLQDYANMPLPQENWGLQEGNQLINEQRAYNREKLQDLVQRGLATLNPQQSALYHAIMNSVAQAQASTSSLHSGGGCGKTYLSNLIVSAVHARGQIVLCVA